MFKVCPNHKCEYQKVFLGFEWKFQVCIQISLYSDSCIQVSNKKEAINKVFVYANHLEKIFLL